MARPSKLSQEQCERIRMLRAEGASPPSLAKRFKISESSMYKILNGSYVAAPSSASTLPPVVPQEDMGSTPSLFRKAGVDEPATTRVIKAAETRSQPIDEVTLAAAELIVAQARYAQLRKHTG